MISRIDREMISRIDRANEKKEMESKERRYQMSLIETYSAYEYRNQLFIALMRSMPEISWRANNHHDGTSYSDWFIAGMHLPTGDISYHLPAYMWRLLDRSNIATSLRAPEWDGHTPDDVVKRLKRFNMGDFDE